MRGKVVSMGPYNIKRGITPAYAGKSCCSVLRLFGRWDHPRVCGEKLEKNSGLRKWAGSPPRMRGKVIQIDRHQIALGITPAYAGKSVVTWCSVAAIEDHPRVCGEKILPRSSKDLLSGSPPRMRGKDERDNGSVPHEGITPAYAGKRNPQSLKRRSSKDHPRVCGEKTKKIP